MTEVFDMLKVKRKWFNSRSILIVGILSLLNSISNAQVLFDKPLINAEKLNSDFKIGYDQAGTPVTFHHSGADHLKLNFGELNLAPGDTVTVSSPDGNQVYTYPNDPMTSDEDGLWALTIFGDTAILTLNRNSDTALDGNYEGVSVGKYWRGFTKEEIDQANPVPESICGSDDKRDAVCWSNDFPKEFEMADAVARISFGGGLCTAWRVGPSANNDLMITNNHCIDNQNGVNATEVWFRYQNTSCNGGSTTANRVIVTGNQFFTTDDPLDMTLFSINNAGSVAEMGYLSIDTRRIQNGHVIYIPQHPGGRPKEMAIFDDQNGGQRCRVDNNNDTGGRDLGYFCDTEGGSSGSPVLALDTHQVVALHHFGGCTNSGARADRFYPLIDQWVGLEDPNGGPTPTPSPTPNPIVCAPGAINLENTQDYSSASTGQVFVDANGCTAYLSGNIWQLTNQGFNIDANSVVEFDFATNGTAEIVGVGFDEDAEASADRVFQLGGSQVDWGITNFSYTGNGELQSFSIPVGEFYTGAGMGFVIANDKDEGAPDNEVIVSNVIISSVTPPTPPPTPTPSPSPSPAPTATPTPLPIACIDGAVDFSNTGDYSSSSTGEIFVDANGCTAYLSGNIWRITNERFTITENTVIEFEFASNGLGEIQGVGLDEDADASADRIFRLAGTQDWGLSNFTYSGNGELQSFSIPVGDFFTGESFGFVLANDKDDGVENNRVTVSNLVIREISTPTPRPTSTPVAPTPPPVDANWFFIVHKPTGSKLHSCTDVDRTPVATRPNRNTGTCVQWRQVPVGNFFHIQNRKSEKYIKPDTEENGSPISVIPNTWTGNWTQWSYEDTGDGFGYLINRATGKIIHRNAQANTLVRQQPSSWRGDFTRWQFEAAQ